MSTRRYPGWFVVFEGGDGVGKSTQVELLADALADAGVSHLVTREPGGTPLGDNIRELLLDPASGDVAPRAEALLYAADKAQHLHEVVVPALAAGKVVVCDRYLDSMLAYQGAGRVLELREVADIADWATRGLRPDLTVLLDLDPDEAVGMKEHKDRLEQAGVEFHRRVRQGFLDLANADPER
ncbi:MAG: dTMP kinase, partial [Propionibacterium sp.]|nr:dTMP kinase [Propionibacterium sp.]